MIKTWNVNVFINKSFIDEKYFVHNPKLNNFLTTKKKYKISDGTFESYSLLWSIWSDN